jgi:hypothetical protein
MFRSYDHLHAHIFPRTYSIDKTIVKTNILKEATDLLRETVGDAATAM